MRGKGRQFLKERPGVGTSPACPTYFPPKFPQGFGEGGLEEGGGITDPRPSPPYQQTRVLIVAGEASGDRHGAQLVTEMRKLLPQARFLGVGGEALAAQGIQLLARAEDLAVVGFTEVAARLPAVIRALSAINRVLREQPFALVILVDFPDFNFWVARLASWRRVPVMYYISPQVWAWRRYRVRTIARYVKRMVVIFPFEEDFYRRQGVPVTFVGHPFLETLPKLPPRNILLKEWGLDPQALTIALLPGSRPSEIERHLPTMLKAARLILLSLPEAQFLLPLASPTLRRRVEELVEDSWGEGDIITSSGGLPIKIVSGQAYGVLKAAHVAIVASGTVTLEAALAGVPAVIIYKLAPLTFLLARRVIRVPHVGMANLLAGERIYPELLQDYFTPAAVAREVLGWVTGPHRLSDLRPRLTRVVRSLGTPGAAARAAQVAVELLADQGPHR